ncbi:MAG TPA: hypothetical protein DCM08_00575 [Microscillaceae bacterium]|jgi:cellulose synthase/poly-beta-1,6-N-acetylglucosamine synthase-like glycosyltransferase|nr:hypothetical protein [Microscillaceae bacterium]
MDFLNVVGVVCLISLGLLVGLQIWQVGILWQLPKETYPPPSVPSLPFISILIAVRNEETNLPICFAHLAALDYPPSQYEILWGDDQSTDASLHLLEQFAQKHPPSKIYAIYPDSAGQLQGKANVLAQLGGIALRKFHIEGHFLFFTDADMAVSPTWLNGLLQGFEPNVGIVTGFSLIQSQTIFQHCQALDWASALGMIRVAEVLRQPITTMGNNMAVRREAYEAVGGYEAIPFSVTEDFELFRHIVQAGFGFRTLINPWVTAYSAPVQSWQALMQQRKRWMRGALQLPWFIVSILVLQACFFPLWMGVCFWQWPIGAVVWALKWGLQTIFLRNILRKAKAQALLPYAWMYDFWAVFFTIGLVVSARLPGKLHWKGRQY